MFYVERLKSVSIPHAWVTLDMCTVLIIDLDKNFGVKDNSSSSSSSSSSSAVKYKRKTLEIL